MRTVCGRERVIRAFGRHGGVPSAASATILQQRRRLRKPEHQVEILHGRAAGAFDQVVFGADQQTRPWTTRAVMSTKFVWAVSLVAGRWLTMRTNGWPA